MGLDSKQRISRDRAGHIIAAIMILSFALLSFSGMASALVTVTVYGSDHIDGFRRVDDKTIVKVYTSTRADLSILTTSGESIPIQCFMASIGYNCEAEFPEQTQSPGAYSITVKNNDTGETITATYRVDGEPPSVEDVSYTQNGNTLTANYVVTDSAYSHDGKGVGLKSIKLLVNDNIVAEDSLSDDLASGTISGEVTGIEGTVSVKLLVEDSFGQSAEGGIVDRFVDALPPVVSTDYQLLTADGTPITAVSSESGVVLNADLKLLVSDSSLRSVSVDVSELTGNDDDVRAASCRQVAEKDYECVVSGLSLRPVNENPSVEVVATDRFGNTQTATIFKELKIINDRPQVTFLGIDGLDCGSSTTTCHTNSGLKLVKAVVNAPGGLSPDNLFLNFNDRKVSFERCSLEGGSSSVYDCYLNITIPLVNTGAILLLVIDSESSDLVGNKITGVLSRPLFIDNNNPLFNSELSTNINCPTATQPLTISFEVKEPESNRLSIIADSGAISYRDHFSTYCEDKDENTGVFNCSIRIDDIKILTSNDEHSVTIWVVDEAGNNASKELNTPVCLAEGTITPNFITSVEQTGEAIVDKRLASIIPFRTETPIRLTISNSLNGEVSVNRVLSVICDNPWIQKSEIIGTGDEQLLVNYFYYEDVWPENITADCKIDYEMREGFIIYEKPEVEVINLTFEGVRDELGNPSEEIITKKNKLAVEIKALEKSIKKKEAIDHSLGKFCDMVYKIAMIDQGLQAIKALIGSVAITIGTISSSAGESLWKATHFSLGGFHANVNHFLWPPGLLGIFKKDNAVGYAVKWTCMVYNCAFYNAGVLGSLASEAAMKYVKVKVNNKVKTLGDIYAERFTKNFNEIVSKELNYPKGTEKVEIKKQTESNDNEEITVYKVQPMDKNGGALGDSITIKPGDPLYDVYSNNLPAGKHSITSLTPSLSSFNTNLPSGTKKPVVGTMELSYEKGVDSNPDKFTISIYNPKNNNNGEDWSTYSIADYGASQSTDTLVNALLQNDAGMIIDPYKNGAYDGLCLPAQLYNDQKERELKCLQLKCIDQSSKAGLPIDSCDETAEILNCLYVEGAYSKVGGSSDLLKKALVKIGMAALTNLGMTFTYGAACLPYLDVKAFPEDAILAQATKAIACGISGTVLRILEIRNVKAVLAGENERELDTHYCAGLEEYGISDEVT